MTSYFVRIYRFGRVIGSFDFTLPVEVGRRDPQKNEPAPIAVDRLANPAKLIVGEATDQEIARRWFRFSVDDAGQIVVENLHPQLRVTISNQSPIASGEKRHFQNDVLIDLGCNMAIRAGILTESQTTNDAFRTLDSIPPSPGVDAIVHQERSLQQFATLDATEIVKMLRLALQVVHKAAGSNAFFQAAAQAAADIVDLDRVLILLRQDAKSIGETSAYGAIDGWHSVAEHFRDGMQFYSFGAISRTVLQRVIDTTSTIIHDPAHLNNSLASPELGQAQSLMQVHCATASPILNREREVIGVVYGDRWNNDPTSPTNRISDIDATLVEVLAGAVAGGISRQKEERLRHTLADFFSPKVVELLATNPKLMDGQEVEISVLFCDIRGFSSVTEKLGPRKSFEWINDVMTELSQCVIERDGVLDYVGDELVAMWGAPGSQPDHACRALDAARAMLAAIETLRARWNDILPQRFGAGIGVNTGLAQVGNIGSRQRFKYGALGNSVNVGSRLQSATKQLGVDCLASGETVRAADQTRNCRRLTQLTMVGIEQAIDVYEVNNKTTDEWIHLARNYELALADFEAQRFGDTERRIEELTQSYPNDQPSKKLLGRAIKERNEPSIDFSPIWNLTQK